MACFCYEISLLNLLTGVLRLCYDIVCPARDMSVGIEAIPAR